jgi:hypothetical protein
MNNLYHLLIIASIVVVFERCNFDVGRNNYLILVSLDTNAAIKGDAKVLLNGKQVGILDYIDTLSGDRRLLTLRIYDSINIPRNSKISYLENIFEQRIH